jgi:mono/diheme cytochrome c family protein
MNLKKLTLCAAALVLFACANRTTAADDDAPSAPTFYKDVLPILQQNCQVCHRAGGADMGGMIAPMSLVTFEETRPWAKSIAKETTARTMPPWHASPVHHGVFDNERTLTEEQIKTIARWAETGAAQGDSADAPPPVQFKVTGGYAFGEPDLIVKMPEPYFIADDVEDLYIDFETTISEKDLPEPRWVQAHQVKAGSDAVHHVISSLGSLVPGGDPRIYREGYGRLVKPGDKVTFQMHYHKEKGEGTGRWDQTEVGLKFYPAGYQPKYKFDGDPMGNFRFRIPPGDANYSAESEFVFDRDARLVSFMPHMHVRGKAVKITAHYPDGKEELLLDVPKYDFNWQTTYEYKEYKAVPKGTRLHMTAWWDNSAENPNNPDPTKEVRWGKPTTDEMMFAWMRYTDPIEGAGDVGEGDNAVEEGDATDRPIEEGE